MHKAEAKNRWPKELTERFFDAMSLDNAAGNVAIDLDRVISFIDLYLGSYRESIIRQDS